MVQLANATLSTLCCVLHLIATLAVMLFDTLDRYLKQQQMRAREVFDHFDQEKRGWLTPSELGKLVTHFLQHLSKGDLHYFQVCVVQVVGSHCLPCESQCLPRRLLLVSWLPQLELVYYTGAEV